MNLSIVNCISFPGGPQRKLDRSELILGSLVASDETVLASWGNSWIADVQELIFS